MSPWPLVDSVSIVQDQAYCQNSQYFRQYLYLKSQEYCQRSQYLPSTSTSESSTSILASVTSISRVPVTQSQVQCKYSRYLASITALQFVFKRSSKTQKLTPGGLPSSQQDKVPCVGFCYCVLRRVFELSPGRNDPLRSRNHRGCVRPRSTPCTGSTPPR